MAVFGATGGASKASDRCSFTKISENNKDWCNGRGKQGKDALACVPKVSQGCGTNKAHTDPHPTKSERDSAENLIDGADGEQSPP